MNLNQGIVLLECWARERMSCRLISICMPIRSIINHISNAILWFYLTLKYLFRMTHILITFLKHTLPDRACWGLGCDVVPTRSLAGTGRRHWCRGHWPFTNGWIGCWVCRRRGKWRRGQARIVGPWTYRNGRMPECQGIALRYARNIGCYASGFAVVFTYTGYIWCHAIMTCCGRVRLRYLRSCRSRNGACMLSSYRVRFARRIWHGARFAVFGKVGVLLDDIDGWETCVMELRGSWGV